MIKQWKQRSHNPANEASLLQAGHGNVISRLLSQRGITVDKAREFLDADPGGLSPVSTLHGLRKAVTIMLQGSLNGSSVIVIGDYDVDGVISTVMMKSICDDLHMPFKAFLPSRFDHGYGLNEKTYNSFMELYGSNLPDILVTCDCGTSSEKWVKKFKEAGIKKVLVIDHHIVEDSQFSKSADTVVNWRLGGNEMCAAGHVFFLAKALKEAASDVSVDSVAAYAAIATIADVTPVKGDNRIIVRHGLKMIKDAKAVGLSMLATKCKVDFRNLSQEDVAFKIAPRINAPGRMSHCVLSYDMMVETDYVSAMEKANDVEALNLQRRAVQQQIEKDCVAQIGEDFKGGGILAVNKDWHTGVIGIVASQVSRKYGVPCVLIGGHDGILKGSGRSIQGVNIKAIMDRCNHLFSGYGGHEMAAGATLKQEFELTAGKEFEEACTAHITEHKVIEKDNLYDMDLSPSEMTRGVGLDIAGKMHPYCEDGNPEPVFMVRNLDVEDVKVKEGGDWRMVIITGSVSGQKVPMKMKAFSDDWGDNLVGKRVNMAFTFPQKDDPQWGMDLTIIDIEEIGE